MTTRSDAFTRIGERMQTGRSPRPVSFDMPQIHDLIRQIEDRIAVRGRAAQ